MKFLSLVEQAFTFWKFAAYELHTTLHSIGSAGKFSKESDFTSVGKRTI